ncbi:MAG: hypothetical protein U9Q07_04005 [Planctomycetota bacterium]|nr:hypothetical protein [Planctomycetota bacterium]
MTKYICETCKASCTLETRTGEPPHKCVRGWLTVNMGKKLSSDDGYLMPTGTDHSDWREVKDPRPGTVSGYRIWRTPHGQMFLPADWDGKVDKEVVFYPPGHCPECREKDAEIERLQKRLAKEEDEADVLLLERDEAREEIKWLKREHAHPTVVREMEKEVKRLKKESADWEETAGRMSDRAARLDGEIEDLKVVAHNRITEIGNLRKVQTALYGVDGFPASSEWDAIAAWAKTLTPPDSKLDKILHLLEGVDAKVYNDKVEARSKERQAKTDELNRRAFDALKGLSDQMAEISERLDGQDTAAAK